MAGSPGWSRSGRPRPDRRPTRASGWCWMRTSPVIDSSGGLFPLMKRAWSLGAGAKLGDGTQHMPLIQLGDYLRFVLWAAENAEASGPYNLTLPRADHQRRVHRRAGQPAAVARASSRRRRRCCRRCSGDFAEQLLGDVWLVPRQAVDQGFELPGPRRPDRHPVLAARLTHRRAPGTSSSPRRIPMSSPQRAPEAHRFPSMTQIARSWRASRGLIPRPARRSSSLTSRCWRTVRDRPRMPDGRGQDCPP